jgi:hypothetical protein
MKPTPAKISTEESILIANNRDAGLDTPRALPKPWHDLTPGEKTMCLWYIHNTLSYFDKNAVARHIIGLEILAEERAGISPVMTAKRADEIWKLVFNK